MNRCFISFTLFTVLILQSSNTAFSQIHYITLESNQPQQLVVDSGPDVLSAPTSTIVFNQTSVVGGVQPYTYLWAPSSNLSDPNIENPSLNLVGAANVYTLTVTDANGCSAQDEIQIEVVITDIEDISGKRFFNVYPNPASEFITVEAFAENGSLKIYNQQGDKIAEHILKKGDNKILINVLSAGVYNIQLVTDDGKERHAKILIK
jgi:hypothetical protein